MQDYFPSSLIVKKVTTAITGDDAAHPISDIDIPFYAADLQCQLNALKIGVGGSMYFVLQPNETYWTYNANLRDFLIQNNVAGNDGELVILATVPNAFVEKALKKGGGSIARGW